MRLSLRAAAAGAALAAVAGWNITNVGAVADELADAYGVSLAVIGLFTTALFATHAAMQIPAGRLCDRFGARLVGGSGLVVIAVASAAAMAWREAAFAIAMRAVTGIGTGLVFVSGSDYVRATVGSAVAQGFYGAGSMAAGGLALALVPLSSSWRAPFWSALVVAVVALVLVALAPRAAPASRRAAAVAPPRASLRDRRLVPLAVMHAASFGLSVVVGNWVVTLLERGADYSAAAAGGAGALTLFLGIVTRPLGGRWADRPALLRASFVLGGIGTVVLAFAPPLAVAVSAAAVVGLAAGIPFAPSFAGAARVRPDAPAAAVGVVNLAAAVTILVATPLVGLGFDLPGDGGIGFVVVGALWAVAATSVRAPVDDPSHRVTKDERDRNETATSLLGG
jgi:MFS family permease